MEKRRSFIKKCLAMTFMLTGSCGAIPFKSESSQNISFLEKNHKLKNVLVLWYSQTGHTRRHARLIAKLWEKKGLHVKTSNISEFDRNSIADFDLILMGTPVFYYDTPGYVQEWIRGLPALKQVPVAAFVTYGGPEGDQHNAACTILELFSEKGGVPVGQRAFMNMAAFPISWSNNSIAKSILDNRDLPNEETYTAVRSFAESVIEQVHLGYAIPVEKRLTLRRLSTLFAPIWWTKRLIEEHRIDPKLCTKCGICEKKCPADAISIKTGQVNRQQCVLCFGCLNNCPAQAIVMVYKDRRLFGFNELLKRKHITIKEPKELRQTDKA